MCSHGYTPAVVMVTCTANETWEDTECNIIDCGLPGDIENGNITLVNSSSTTFGSHAYVSCELGYAATLPMIKCQARGVWEESTCIVDCGPPAAIANGVIALLDDANTTYGSQANVNCDHEYVTNTSLVECQENGTWSSARCIIVDCGLPGDIENGNITLVNSSSTTFGSHAYVSCELGYAATLSMIKCQAKGVWEESTCIVDCGPPAAIANGVIALLDDANTTYGSQANVNCNHGYVTNTSLVECQEYGTWSSARCIIVVTETDKCLDDDRLTIEESVCVREELKNILLQINAMGDNTTTEQMTEAIGQLANATVSALQTDKEILLVVDIISKSSDILSKQHPNLDGTQAFFRSVSNIVDEQNKVKWMTIRETDSKSGETIMTSIEKMEHTLRRAVDNGNEGFTNVTIVQKNVAIEVKTVQKSDIIYPYPSNAPGSSDDHVWPRTSESQIRLDADALGDHNVIAITVIYKDMSFVLPESLDTNTSGGTSLRHAVNGPILSMSLSNHSAVLNPPVRLTYKHIQTNFTGAKCSYWKFGSGNKTGLWSTDGCWVEESNATFTVCRCNHLTNFAVLMSPFVPAQVTPLALTVVSIAGVALSIACLLLTILTYTCLWRYLRNDRAVLLLNLSVALLIAYGSFLAGVERTENKIVCKAIAALLHYIYLVVFCLMLAEGIDLVITVVFVFATKSRLQLLLTAGWVVPAIIVGISLGITETKGYGNDNFCWLSLTGGLIWAFVGPALLIILINTICLVLVIKKMFHMKAMANKTTEEKIRTSVRSLCVLVPLIGITWILGIFYVNESAYFVQYLFAICNGLQGVFIFVFNCALNSKVRNAITNLNTRRATIYSVSKQSTREARRNKYEIFSSLKNRTQSKASESRSSNHLANGSSREDSTAYTNTQGCSESVSQVEQPMSDYNHYDVIASHDGVNVSQDYVNIPHGEVNASHDYANNSYDCVDAKDTHNIIEPKERRKSIIMKAIESVSNI
ncbi:hypothetical protein DPMN_051303 [Dreissena polymorpha]|nr:hypothetical protein DPMN_051303 [Dreissena polymorpha]